jgi:hypothetical protein
MRRDERFLFSKDGGVDADFDAGAYDAILRQIGRAGRFDAIGSDLVPAGFDNYQLDPKTAYIDRKQARETLYAAERYRRKRGIPEKPRRYAPPAVVHKFRVLLDRSRVLLDRSRVSIEHLPRVLLDDSPL